jgi:hypothetical protein
MSLIEAPKSQSALKKENILNEEALKKGKCKAK